MALKDRLRMAWRNRRVPLSTLRHSHLSCSQYGEDVIFDRLMFPSAQGTYVDVGAHHPIKGSNTYRLYAHGWSGLTIDPNPAFAPLFRKFRPRDIHIVEGVSSERSDLTYFEFDHEVYNTLSRERADELVAMGMAVVRRTEVPCRPLAELVETHLSGRQIDLLSIDCEGLDLEALKSLDFATHRPTVLMVEDYQMFASFQRQSATGEMHQFMHDAGYSPIAQSGWTRILIANDWKTLVERSRAYSVRNLGNGILPG